MILSVLSTELTSVGLLMDPSGADRINEPQFCQTACTALQIALVALLKSWGIKAVATIGHSSGSIEYRSIVEWRLICLFRRDRRSIYSRIPYRDRSHSACLSEGPSRNTQ